MNLKSKKLIPTLGYLLAALVMIFTIYGLGYNVGQSDFLKLTSLYVPCFISYLYIVYFVKKESWIWILLGLGILLRFLLIFSFPNLSDDIYRFIWDGTLAMNGINPFNHLPSYFVENKIDIPGISLELFNKLNSPNYFSVYPPVCQSVFAFSCWLFPDNWTGSTIVMKVFMFLFECGSLFLLVKILRHFNLPLKNVLIYALNPLIIIEITGNLHFEGTMIFFLLLAVWLLIQTHFKLSAVVIAFSIASKLLPLIFLPFLIRRLGWEKSIRYFSIVGITLLVIFSPLLNGIFIQNFGESLDLYFQKFEFNASAYYLLRWLFQLITGYNQIAIIGPLLGLSVLIGIIFYTFRESAPNNENLFKAMLFAISLYLFLATTIHPWYISLPLVFCVFTSYRFPVIWSALIILTYINYSYPTYHENLWIVGLEYMIVFTVLFWEFKRYDGNKLISI